MGAAFFAPGEAFIHAVTIRLIGNDEDAAVGGGGRDGKQEMPGKHCNECGGSRMDGTGRGKGPPSANRPKVLIMINHGRVGRGRGWLDRPQNGR